MPPAEAFRRLRLLPPPPLLLLLLVVLLIWLDAVSSTTYVLRADPNASRATTALATYSQLGPVRCGIACARHALCRHWHVPSDSGLCQLWPAPSADNPAQSGAGPVYELLQPPATSTTEQPTTSTSVPPSTSTTAPAAAALPACYSEQAEGFAFCVHASPGQGRSDRDQPCQADDPRAKSAFVDSAAKVELLKRLTSGLPQRLWVDMESTGVTHTFADGSAQRSVQVLSSWMYNGASPGTGCARFEPGQGLIIGPCGMGTYGSVCEIRL